MAERKSVAVLCWVTVIKDEEASLPGMSVLVLAEGYGRWSGIGKCGRGPRWLTSNRDGLDIYIKHISTARVDEKTRRIPAVHKRGVSHDRELAGNDGQGQSDMEKVHDGGTEGRICNR